MLFWIIIVGLAVATGGLLAAGLWRGHGENTQGTDYDLRVYRDQLREVERDLERGVLNAEDAERVRIEISRRILALDAQKSSPPAPLERGSAIMAALLVAGVSGVSLLLYAGIGPFTGLGAPGYGDFALADRIAQAEERRKNRPTQQEAEASVAQSREDRLPDIPPSEAYLTLVQTLRDTVAQRPDDVEGHILLATHEARLGNYSAAHQAQEKVLKIKGDQASVDDLTDYAYLLILSAGGYVSPLAERAARLALANDPKNGAARYYIGLMLAQNGRPDQAFRLWDRLLREGPREAPWIEPILAEIPGLAQIAGVPRYQIPAIGQTATKGPSAQDIENAQNMDAESRQRMIESMVANLSDRLATQGGPPRDWAQLITAQSVLGRKAEARAVLKNARDVFAADAAALDVITKAAASAGIDE